MLRLNISTFIRATMCAAAIFAGAAHAQSANRPMAVEPLDLRVGAARPTDPATAINEAGMRVSGAAPSSLAIQLPKEYRVSPNDVIEIEVFEADNLKRSARVNAAGYISLPLIGHVYVAGSTASELEARITAMYSEKYFQNPQVTVFVKEFTSERITIEGAVGRPGIYPLTGQLTLLRALAIAGGFAGIADASKVMVYRVNDAQKREMKVYDVDQIRGGKSEDPRILGDDLIVVQRDSTRVLLKDSLFRDVIDSINPFSILVPR